MPGILDDEATQPRPRPRSRPWRAGWPFRRLRPRSTGPLLPIRQPTKPTAATTPSNGTPSPGSVVARSESVRSPRTAVAALASLAVHRPASQRKDSRP